jgi:succinate dehydrogenase / fumarate reductase, cytochrome b subunit
MFTVVKVYTLNPTNSILTMIKRPVYLNLFRLHLPLLGWISILHRVTGVLLFLALPAGLYVLQLSLSGQAGFSEAAAILKHPLGRLFSLTVIASLAYHAFAGLRHLAMDVHWGLDKNRARVSARWVMIASGIVTMLAAWRLLG